MDLRTCVIEAFDKLVETKKIEQIIETHLTKTIDSVISDALRSYGDFGKMLEAKVKEAFALNGNLDLPSYNQTILNIIKKQVEAYTHNTLQRQVVENMTELLEPPPAEIKLSELIKQFVEMAKEEAEGGCVCHGQEEISLHIRHTDSNFVYVSMDTEGGKKPHECDIDLGIYKDEVFSLRFRQQRIEKELFAGEFRHFERMLFQMKALKTKIVLDVRSPDEVETSYAVHD